jgi:poly(3-hydroxyalkanoate) synthetase
MDNEHKVTTSKEHKDNFSVSEVEFPSFLGPFSLFQAYEAKLNNDFNFLRKIQKTQMERPEPVWATENQVFLDLKTMRIRDFSTHKRGVCTLVVSPYAGHTSVIVDFAPNQSLVCTLMENGLDWVCATEWKSATRDMMCFNIDNYLNELNTAVDDLGGFVNLVGVCQGGWLSAMFAARFPHKVNTLTMGGAPIDTDAGQGKIKEYAQKLPMKFFEELVAAGNGNLKGEFLLTGFKNLNPERNYIQKYVNLYERIEDPLFVKRFETFERWYEYTIDLPGTFYLQIVKELFKENRLFEGKFIGLGRRLSLENIHCPVYLLAGEKDDITPKEQVFSAEKRLGTKKNDIVQETIQGGHIGLFMRSSTLKESWPKISHWIASYSEKR